MERDDLCGRSVGEFVLRERIGEGGFGAVYRCEQPLLGRAAVVKVLHQRLRGRDVALQRFMREAQLASHLDHPYAAHVYAFGVEDDGLCWIAMELVRGTSLDRWLRDRGPLPLEQLAPLFERICEVVQTAHERGIVHRDLKPANVMLIERAGRMFPKLLDFGVAKLLDTVSMPPLEIATPIVSSLRVKTEIDIARESAVTVRETRTNRDAPVGEAPLTVAGAAVGSPPYMSPEQWTGLQVGPAADLYALGIVAYECLTGTRPFHAKSDEKLAELHLHTEVPPVGGEFPPTLDEFFRRALAKRPEDRPPTALQLAARFRIAAKLAADPSELPRLDEAVRDAWLAAAPQPLAEAVAVLEAAYNPHQARDAALELFHALVRYLLAIALAAHAQVRTESDVTELLRAMRQGELDDEARVHLLHRLVEPFIGRAAVYPVPELVALVASDAFAPVLVQQAATDRSGGEALVLDQLARLVPALATLLRAAGFLLDYTLTVPRANTIERWMGPRCTRRPRSAIKTPFVDDQPLLAKDGVPCLLLWPLVQRLAPTPGQKVELFVFDGHGRHGARLVASPSGYEHHAVELWEWFGSHVIGDPAPSTAKPDDDRAPYLGLAAFSADDADRFIGRELEIDAFVNRLRDRTLLVVVGPSGAGKSSFVHAGVVPALAGTRPIIAMRPGATPYTTLAAKLATVTDRSRVLVIVDQLEELFTSCTSPEQVDQFAAELAALAGPESEARVICTVRDDFLIRLDELAPLRELLSPSLVLIGNPARADLVRTIVEPARRVGYTLSDDRLASDMVDEVADRKAALALLSFTASRLWELRDRRFRHLTRNAYDAMGGVRGALVQHAEATLEALGPDEQRIARDVFRSLVTGDATRAVLTTAELRQHLATPRADRVVDKLVAARLLAVADTDGDARIEIIHEALIDGWPRLAAWVREDPEAVRMREQLRTSAKQWHDRGEHRGLLWRGDLLLELARWRTRTDVILTAVETRFVTASERDARRTRRFRRGLLGLAFVVLAATSVVMFALRHDAVNERSIAQSQLVTSYIDQARTKLVEGRRWESLAKIVAAQALGARSAVLDTMRALARTPARALEYRISTNGGRTWGVVYSPDNRLLATSGEDGAALWDAGTGALHAHLGGHQSSVRDATFDPTGTRVATAGYEGMLRLFSTDTGAQLAAIPTKNAIVRCVAWRPDGRLIATAGDNGVVEIWDAATGANRFTIIGDAHDEVDTCAFGPELLAFGTRTGRIALVSSETGTLRILGHHDGWTRSVVFDESNTRLVSASHDKTVRVWDVVQLRELKQLATGGEQLFATFSPDGTRVVGTGRDGMPRIWNATTGALLETLVGHHGTAWYAEFSRDGRRIVTSGDDGTARIWDVVTGMPLATLEGHSAAVLRARFSRDGTHVVSASYDGTVVAWKWHAAERIELVPTNESGCALRASTDRGRVALACPQHTRVWNADTSGWQVDLPGAELASATATRALLGIGDRVHVFELPTGRPLGDYTVVAPIVAIADGPDRFAVADRSTDVLVIPADGAALHITVPAPPTGLIVLPAGKLLVFDTVNAQLYGPTLEQTIAIDHTDQDLYGIRAGDAVAVVGLKDILLFDPATKTLVALSGHQAPTLDASFDRTGTRMVSTSQDGTAIVWDVATRRLVRRLVSRSLYLSHAVFDSTGTMIVALDGGGQLQFFDIDSGDLIGELDGAMARPSTLHRANDGSYSAFDANGARVTWRLPADTEPLAAAIDDLACKAPPNERVGSCLEVPR